MAKLLRTSAWTNGRDTVGDWDCWLLQHCLGEEKEHRAKAYEWYASRVGAVATKPDQLIRLVGAFERRLDKHRKEERVKQDSKGRRLYLRGDGSETTDEEGQKYRDGEPLFLGPDSSQYYRSRQFDRTNEGKGYTRTELKELMDRSGYGYQSSYIVEHVEKPSNWFTVKLQPAVEPMRHPRVYVEQRLADLKEVRKRVTSFQEGLDDRIRSLNDELATHLWVMPEFVDPASAKLQAQHEDARKLVDRVDRIIRGYESLPQAEDAPVWDEESEAS